MGCVNGICRQIVEQAGVGINFSHNYGCSQLGDDHENTRKILADMVLHPNAGGVLVVGLGCENNQPREFEKLLGDYDRQRIRFLIAQETEGNEVEAGAKIVRELYEQARSDERKNVDGAWFRAFNYRDWDYWASNADAGWGAQSTLTGWIQSWIVTTLALMEKGTSYWDVTLGK